MDVKAFDQAELTLLTRQVKYRDETGAEKTALELKPYGLVKFAESGQEGGYIVPITLNWEGGTYPNDGTVSRGLRVFIDTAPVEDENTWTHKFGDG